MGSSFRESFDSLSGSSQQALQQLVTRSSKLLPEGASIRDSYDKLSESSQHALLHLVKSGISLPSLLPHRNAAHDIPAAENSKEAGLAALLSSAAADSQAAHAQLQTVQAQADSAQADLSAAQTEIGMLSDLLQRSQAELRLSEGRTHELLTSVAQYQDAHQEAEGQANQLQTELAAAVKAQDSCHRTRCQCTEEAKAGAMPEFLGPLVWAYHVSVPLRTMMSLPVAFAFSIDSLLHFVSTLH